MNLKNAVLALAVLAFVGFVSGSFADDTKVAGKKSLESRIAELEAKLKDAGVGGGVKGSGIKISGYVDTSYLINLADRDSSGPVQGSSYQNTGRVFDQQFDAFNINQVKVTIQKDKDNSKFPAGFRTDIIMGEDANVLNASSGAAAAAGNDIAAFLEQAYVNLGVPLGNGIDVKFGKMVSLIGYEAIESAANWQFSRSDGFRLAPTTQTGVTFGYKWNDTVTTTVGAINGWNDIIANRGAENFNTDLSFVGRVDVTGPKTKVGDFNAFVAGLYGNDDPSNTNPTLNRANVYVWEIGGTWDKPFGVKELSLGVDYLYRYQQVPMAAAVVDKLIPVSGDSLSIYGKWDWASCGAKWTSTSGRFSYSTYDNNSDTGLNNNVLTLSPLAVPAAGFRSRSEEVFSFTLTQAFNVWKDTLVRLEWRHDWTPNKASGFGVASGAANGDDIRQQQDTLAVNVVYSF
jgi:hypothetical protein